MNYYSMNLDIINLDDNIIRLACTIQLRVLIVALKYKSEKFSIEQIAKSLKIGIREIEEAIEFWSNLGIIKICDENQHECLEDKKEAYLVKRISSDEEMREFFQSIENIMGRPLSGADISIILSLKDNEGLRLEVILLLIKYCLKIRKTSMRYIEQVGISWGKNQVNSVEKAKKQIESLRSFEKLWNKFRKIIGISQRAPTKKEEEAIKRWFVDWKFREEMVVEAYEKCVNSKGTYILSYMDGIIKRWQKNGITKVEEIDNKKVKNSKPSYDIEKYFSVNALDSEF